MNTPYRPVPGKFTVEMVQNRIVKVLHYDTDSTGEFIEVRLAGSYGATVRLPLSCIRRPTEEEARTIREEDYR